MKIGLAIAPENASPLAFVVYRDRLEVALEKAARLGYDGVELALRDAAEVDPERLGALLAQYGLELPAISTGRVFSEGQVWCTHPDPAIRRRAVAHIKGLIALAARFGARVNLGRVRGPIPEGETREAAQERFLECLQECAGYAATLGVELLLEPVNRYEINYINSVPEALEVLRAAGCPNVRLMPDVFHMNIEDGSIPGSLILAGEARCGQQPPGARAGAPQPARGPDDARGARLSWVCHSGDPAIPRSGHGGASSDSLPAGAPAERGLAPAPLRPPWG